MASDGRWYPPKLPPPPGYGQRVAWMTATLVLWAASGIAYIAEHNAQAAARSDCAMYDLVHGTRTLDFCPTPAMNWTVGLVTAAIVVTVITVSNLRPGKGPKIHGKPDRALG